MGQQIIDRLCFIFRCHERDGYIIRFFFRYRAVTLLEKNHYKWLVEFAGSGKQIEVYEDKFEIE